MTRYAPLGSKKTPGPVIKVKGISRGSSYFMVRTQNYHDRSAQNFLADMSDMRIGQACMTTLC